MKVLVVDDASSVRQRVVAGLKRVGGVTRVVEASSGEEALEILEEYRPDLVILDLRLPGMSGLEVLKAIRERDREMRVAIFTNYPYPAFRLKCRELGATGFFCKSTEVDRILALLEGGDEAGEGAGREGSQAP